MTVDDLIEIILTSHDFHEVKRAVRLITEQERKEFEEAVRWANRQEDMNA